MKNTHSIRKVFLEIDTHSMERANAIKNDLAVFVQNELVPLLEKQFNAIEGVDHQIFQIDKLEISLTPDAGKSDIFTSGSETKNQIVQKVRKALNDLGKATESQMGSKPGLRAVSNREKAAETLLYFIENGGMPWWTTKKEEAMFFGEITAEVLQSDAFIAGFQKLIAQEKARKRVVDQFSNHQIALFAAALGGLAPRKNALSGNILLQLLDQQPHAFMASFWDMVFKAFNNEKLSGLADFYQRQDALLSGSKISFEVFIQSIKVFAPFDLSDGALLKMKRDYRLPEKEKPVAKPGPELADDHNKAAFEQEKPHPESYYVQNAGLIILHPFFKELLKDCGLIDGKNIISDKELAAHILHYAATKRENDYEHEMLFEKFLCGIPRRQSIRREIRIGDKHKAHVEQMLLSAAGHWSALKNTSVAILRSEFLQREGKLNWSEPNPKLTVERKTQDLLLEKIPWNITMVKIPWIEKLIYTQW